MCCSFLGFLFAWLIFIASFCLFVFMIPSLCHYTLHSSLFSKFLYLIPTCGFLGVLNPVSHSHSWRPVSLTTLLIFLWEFRADPSQWNIRGWKWGHFSYNNLWWSLPGVGVTFNVRGNPDLQSQQCRVHFSPLPPSLLRMAFGLDYCVLFTCWLIITWRQTFEFYFLG